MLLGSLLPGGHLLLERPLRLLAAHLRLRQRFLRVQELVLQFPNVLRGALRDRSHRHVLIVVGSLHGKPEVLQRNLFFGGGGGDLLVGEVGWGGGQGAGGLAAGTGGGAGAGWAEDAGGAAGCGGWKGPAKLACW